jgi:ribonuclease T2
LTVRLAWMTGLCLVALAATADAAPRCNLPTGLRPAPELVPPAAEIVRDVPTAYYVLALTWSPEWCRVNGEAPSEQVQCRRNNFAFVLHGLWANGAGDRHPRYCAAAPPLSPATLRRMICTTPSAELLQHEWAAHGTCAWRSADAYYRQALALWTSFERPDLAGLVPTATAGSVRDAFIARNPSLPRDSIIVELRSGNRLYEVQLCYDLAFRPARCPAGIETADDVAIEIEPVRGAKR